MKAYYDNMRKKQQDDATSSVLEAAKSGALFGGVGGLTSGILSGQRSLRAIGMRGLGAAAALGATAAGGTALGNTIFGAPEEGEKNPYAKRAGWGTGIAGGVAGAGLGYLLGSGKLRGVTSLAGKTARHFEAPLDNIVTDRIKSVMAKPSTGAGLILGGSLGALGAGLGAAKGIDEGIGIDYLHKDPDDQQRRRVF